MEGCHGFNSPFPFSLYFPSTFVQRDGGSRFARSFRVGSCYCLRRNVSIQSKDKSYKTVALILHWILCVYLGTHTIGNHRFVAHFQLHTSNYLRLSASTSTRDHSLEMNGLAISCHRRLLESFSERWMRVTCPPDILT